MRLWRLLAAALIVLGFAYPAFSQTTKQRQKPQVETRQVKRATFSGSETWMHNLYYVQSDCTSGPDPEVRMVTKPKNGDIHFEQRKVPINFAKDSPRASCNGKPVDAVSIVYQSKEGFVGTDQITLDVNYKDGNVVRYVYTVEVR
jgi:hypothetical protein